VRERYLKSGTIKPRPSAPASDQPAE
jgi:hypothetical protein